MEFSRYGYDTGNNDELNTRFGVFAAVVESEGNKAIIQVGDFSDIEYTVNTINSLDSTDVRCYYINVTGISGDLLSASTDEIDKIIKNKTI